MLFYCHSAQAAAVLGKPVLAMSFPCGTATSLPILKRSWEKLGRGKDKMLCSFCRKSLNTVSQKWCFLKEFHFSLLLKNNFAGIMMRLLPFTHLSVF